MKINNRIVNLQEYHFNKIETLKREVSAKGKDIIDLGIGDPDLSPPKEVNEALIEALSYEKYHNYPVSEGIFELKEQIAKYYKVNYNVDLEKDEILILVGSKEGLSNIIPATCDISDHIILPEPSYPAYEACSRLWGVIPYKTPLIEERGYFPRLNTIPENIKKVAKLMIINYPNNPTGAILKEDFLWEVKKMCREYNIVLCNDGAYKEIVQNNNKKLSILMGGIDNCIEFGSFSKAFSMTGYRIAYVAGDKNIIKALLKVKSNIDSGQFIPIQYAALKAIKDCEHYIEHINHIYYRRKILAENILKEKGLEYFKGQGTFYIWCKVPKGYTTDEFCNKLLVERGIVVTPGYVFGKLGFGHFRISLTKEEELISKALNSIDKISMN
ncbi:aminotransferase class I/II-fold pyridoxal phosphate-dependent enzyme [Clostridium amazonitimonense]|uniref:aminotransferase class I/II-fold pyridoxal phosphate-dependent enzyme n=1 Tax=Clostridium amazonitimonense TaxID=1499689 RepID=UPI0005094D82|nr:aminotransferase class I/II-fold pyridoxal phosphate-dependent enzyme [Clostridium amazonitimonense]